METSLIDWSRILFAVTAAYHWLFVPLTLGLSMVMAIMETVYVIKGDEFWKKTSKFWMKLFAINFAIGIATGIILEFEFGTNWSNYSWFVGDIFGAPLAIEGVLAFFMEATFFAVMFFGWNKVSKRFHLASTWLTGIGASISAYWILVANGWMQHPTGTMFNPDTVRSEMISFWAVIGNPVAVSKFFHSVFSGWMTGGIFTVGVSCWYLLKKREQKFATASIAVGCFVAVAGGFATMISGDSSAILVAKHQPMKLAASEGLHEGGNGVPLSVVPGVKVPGLLSFLATHEFDGYVPGINNIIAGYTAHDGSRVPSAREKIDGGKIAIQALADYNANKNDNPERAATALKTFRANEKYLGYGYLNSPEDLIPNVPLLYWSFRIMVLMGLLLMIYVIAALYYHYKNSLQDKRWMQILGIAAIPVVYICGQAGWIVAELGRQPWTIQDLLPINVAVSSLSTTAVLATFILFLVVFALFLIVELRIMFKAISKGPRIEEKGNVANS